MNRISSLLPSRWTVVLLAATALALAGCGRKGPLDLPPTGTQPLQSQSTSSTAPPVVDSGTRQQAATESLFSSGADAPPTAAKGTKKPFVLDPLLNSK